MERIIENMTIANLKQDFSLLNHNDNLNREDIFRLLRDSGVGIPAYYEKIPFTIDGQTGMDLAL